MDQSSDPVLLVYLDRYHLGDPLFLARFAPSVKAHEGPVLLLHGSGEAAERALEAQGWFAQRAGGVLQVEGAAERALVERAARDLNREVVHALNEAGVSALRVSGTDRGLLREESSGALAVGRVDWLRRLAEQGAVPVIALLAGQAGETVEVGPARGLAAVAAAFAAGGAAPVVVMLSKAGAGSSAGGNEALVQAVAEPETARAVAATGVRVRASRPASLLGKGVPRGADLSVDGV